MIKESIKITELDYSWILPAEDVYVISATYDQLRRINNYMVEEAKKGKFNMYITMQKEDDKIKENIKKILSSRGYTVDDVEDNKNTLFLSWVSPKHK